MPFVQRPRRVTQFLSCLAVLAVVLTAACQSTEEPAGPVGTPRVSAEPTAAPSSGSSGDSSGSPSASQSSAKPVDKSDNLDNITVTGEKLKEPKVELKKKPWAIDKTRVKVLEEGKGATVPETGPVEVHYYGVNGRTGEKFDDSFSRGQTATFALDQVVPGFQKGLAGQKAGSRIIVAMPGEDGYDSSGGSPQAGIEVGDTLIFVIDVVSTVLDGPDGEKQELAKDLPQVSDDTDDPKITVPKSDPPTELKVAPVIKGSGAEVSETDSVMVNYRGVLWSDGKVIDENYGDKSQPQTATPSELIPGFSEGLVKQTVGSRVLIVIPPDKAYGPEGNEEMKVPADATLVYVVDILFIQPAQ